MNFERFIAKRYLKSRKSNRILSFISGVSVLGIVLGVATLIVVISVMNGFSDNLKNRILGANAHIVINRVDVSPIENWRDVQKEIASVRNVTGVSPFIISQVLLTSPNNVSGVVIRGVNAQDEMKVTTISKFMKEGSFADLSKKGSAPQIALGKELAANLGVLSGDMVTMVSPLGKKGPFGITPKMKYFQVCGVFDTGMYEYNNTLAYIDIKAAQEFFGLSDVVSGFSVGTSNFDLAVDISKEIQHKLDFPFWARDWISMNQNLFSALKLEKYAMFIILTLIIIVASFNVISMITVTVKDKKRDIAILRAMGASESSISGIFKRQGMIIGITGTLIGNILGLAICLILANFKIISLPADVYFMDRIPVKIEVMTFVVITVCSLVITYLAGLYPSRQSAKLDPVEALRRD
ncbi:lipoprotein-releasing ABC transporter permease subunit [Seleniivibrio woodruffii]|uniref:Lipoprotein-releasing system permease protein n=1 Tax=Seleniivibrio woodruffii TaxID=1078050 RepID=A0A4V6NEH3_9BACT|nr:lipoprotein-releasing ABC transporter permease subunit [Seleniivibrio woodruffii]TCK62091.1 lipoprotein-releasing system permease protein [Seleniivibrio woodruffii]TVZ34792.1 lipoprotein-releasing system permease protein [Seleniivibrio woodruffii]